MQQGREKEVKGKTGESGLKRAAKIKESRWGGVIMLQVARSDTIESRKSAPYIFSHTVCGVGWCTAQCYTTWIQMQPTPLL